MKAIFIDAIMKNGGGGEMNIGGREYSIDELIEMTGLSENRVRRIAQEYASERRKIKIITVVEIVICLILIGFKFGII